MNFTKNNVSWMKRITRETVFEQQAGGDGQSGLEENVKPVEEQAERPWGGVTGRAAWRRTEGEAGIAEGR